jgi:hypothetical protein
MHVQKFKITKYSSKKDLWLVIHSSILGQYSQYNKELPRGCVSEVSQPRVIMHDLICIWVYKGEGRCYTLQFLFKFYAICLFLIISLCQL